MKTIRLNSKDSYSHTVLEDTIIESLAVWGKGHLILDNETIFVFGEDLYSVVPILRVIELKKGQRLIFLPYDKEDKGCGVDILIKADKEDLIKEYMKTDKSIPEKDYDNATLLISVSQTIGFSFWKFKRACKVFFSFKGM